MSDRYCVFGNPVGHSKSPAIHAAFAAAVPQDLSYEAILAPTDGFADSVRAFVAAGGCGANVTVPFKEEGLPLATRLTPRAPNLPAPSIRWFSTDRHVLGDNTDGAGLLRDLTLNLGCRIAGKRVLLLGAGGAARGVIGPLLDARPAALVIANRTAAKAHATGTALCRQRFTAAALTPNSPANPSTW
jgi:shikimate dehydrogenase